MGQFQTSSHYQVEAPNGHSSQGYCTIFTLTGLGLILQTDSALSKSLLLYPGLGYNSPEGAPLPTSHHINTSGHIPAHTTPLCTCSARKTNCTTRHLFFTTNSGTEHSDHMTLGVGTHVTAQGEQFKHRSGPLATVAH